MIMGTIGTILSSISINWTFLIAFIAVCFTAMMSLIQIFGKRVREEDVKRLEKENEDVKQKIEIIKNTAIQREDVKRLEKENEDVKQKIEMIKNTAIQREDVGRLEKENEDVKQKIEALKTTVGQIETEMAIFKEHTRNNEKSIDEMKQDNKDIIQKLDNLLKQLMDFLNE